MQAVVMDRQDQWEDEGDAAFFERLETEYAIEHYFIIVPPGCKVNGTIFEGGMLRRDFKYGRQPKVTLFCHTSVMKDKGKGRVTFTEKGKRTTYLESVA